MNARLRTHLLVAGLTVACSSGAFAQIVINEVVYDSPGSDLETWLELKGPGGASLDGLEFVGINGNGGTVTQTIPLDGFVIPGDGYFVIAQEGSSVPNTDAFGDTNFQNGPDNIVLQEAGGGAVIDAVGYGDFGATDVFVGEGDPAPDQGSGFSIARCPDGSDTDDNSVDFVLDGDPTPGTENDADCGGPGDPIPVTLCEIAEDDADGLPVLLNEYVICSGVVICPTVFQSSTNDIKITDGECCITVFGGDLLPIEIGDEVEVIGTVIHFNGLTEVSNPLLEIRIVSSGNPIPDPNIITTAEFDANGEDYESCLIGFECAVLVDGEWPVDPGSGSVNLVIDDGSGPAAMRIDSDTDIPGSPEPTAPFSVIGVGGQFDSSPPHDSGYQFFPRFLSDFVFDDPACADPFGACCFTDGTCVILTERDCGDAGGQYQGDDTSCEPNPCVPVPTIESSWGKIKSQYGESR